jgi:hypothetical protein
MRWRFWIVALLGMMSWGAADAQYAGPNGSVGGLACLQVTPDISKAVEVQGLGRCSSGCRGCGCNGGPGFRGPPPGYSNPNGDCVGFKDIASVCGPPPHARCRRECKPVVPACLGHGRAWLAANAGELKLTLSWLPPLQILKQDDSNDVAPEGAAPGRSIVEGVQTTNLEALSGAPAFTCGSKRTCTEMSSCEEAMFHYKQCGLSGLDRTKNGVPCKSICGR